MNQETFQRHALGLLDRLCAELEQRGVRTFHWNKSSEIIAAALNVPTSLTRSRRAALAEQTVTM